MLILDEGRSDRREGITPDCEIELVRGLNRSSFTGYDDLQTDQYVKNCQIAKRH